MARQNPAQFLPMTPITNKCIVLDLDQTLIATQDEMFHLFDLEILSNPKKVELRNRTYYFTTHDLEKPGIGTNYDFWGVERPHVHDFLLFCFSYFKIVAVWSAGKRLYVEGIVDHLFKDLPYPDIVFSYDDTTIHPGNIVEKPLVKMMGYNDYLKQYMTLQNTLAIDDNVTTFGGNQANGVLIPAYEPGEVTYEKNSRGKTSEVVIPTIETLEEDETALLQLKYWLLQPEVIACNDLGMLDKSKIFDISVSTYKEMIRDEEARQQQLQSQYLRKSPARKSPVRRPRRKATMNSPDKSTPRPRAPRTSSPKIDLGI